MHHRQVGQTIHIGWPDFGVPEAPYTLVEFDLLGQVFRARVSDAQGRRGGFLVVYDCPDVVLELLAEQATQTLGFKVIVSSLRCSIDGTILHSLDYEWYPTPGYVERPRLVACAISELLAAMQRRGKLD
jgi:hypothetical protein